MKKLTEKDLNLNLNNDLLDFNTTSDLDVSKLKNRLIGQQKGQEAINFGLNVKAEGYNIYVAGQSGTGKTTYAKKFAENIAKSEKAPKDLCYVYNFENPNEPVLLKLKNGYGEQLKEDLEEVVSLLLEELPKVKTDKGLEHKRIELSKDFENNKIKIINKLSSEVEEDGFGVKSSTTGIYLMPIVDGEIINEEEFEELNEDVKDEITKKLVFVTTKATKVMQKIKNEEIKVSKKIDELEYTNALFVVGKFFTELFEKYKNNKKVIKYLRNVKEDILNNIDEFIETEEEEPLQLLPMLKQEDGEDVLEKYKVNLFVNNKKLKHAPVVVEYNSNYVNLIGEIEYEADGNALTTSFMKIKAGAIHKAQGGYLILQINNLLENGLAYEALRRILKTKKITIETSKEYMTGNTIALLKPEDIDLDVKIILVGSKYYYDVLNYYDEEFNKYFKILALFKGQMELNKTNINEIALYTKKFVTKTKGCLDFTKEAVLEIVRYGAALAENQKKISTKFNKISEILIESNVWAKVEGLQYINKDCVKKAIKEKNNRVNIYEEYLNEMLDDGQIMIDTSGGRVGEINGLAVLDVGEHIFGKPSKITATTYIGKAGIVNIEKEAHMSGDIHEKGMQVLTGYLGETYAQNFPLSLSCRICFEQNYSGVDGDSASSTQLYAILSSLADVKIKQGIAVTGSMNQKGFIQPIGGVTYKIEGFFDLCNQRGLTGEQGVIIPKQNVSDLLLKDEVIDAVKQGNFHIYAIETVNEGIEILTGLEAGKKDSNGNYEKDTIHYLALEKLKVYYEKSMSRPKKKG